MAIEHIKNDNFYEYNINLLIALIFLNEQFMLY